MYCSLCGTKLDENVRFCSKCGTKIVSEEEGTAQEVVTAVENTAAVSLEKPSFEEAVKLEEKTPTVEETEVQNGEKAEQDLNEVSAAEPIYQPQLDEGNFVVKRNFYQMAAGIAFILIGLSVCMWITYSRDIGLFDKLAIYSSYSSMNATSSVVKQLTVDIMIYGGISAAAFMLAEVGVAMTVLGALKRKRKVRGTM